MIRPSFYEVWLSIPRTPPMRNLLTFIFALTLTCVTQAQSVIHVDPQRGVDHASVPGTQNEPVRTIGYALSMQQTGQSVRIRLERGQYREETWPLAIGLEEVTIEAVDAGSVVVNGRRNSSALTNFSVQANSKGLTLRGFTLRSAPTTIEMSGSATTTQYTRIKMEEMVLLVADCAIAADVSGLTQLEIDIRLSNLHALQTALELTAREDAHLKVNIQRSYLYGGSDNGIQMLAEGVNASIETNFENCVFRDFDRHAIQFEGQGGQCNLYVVHSNFLDCGASAIRVTAPPNSWSTYSVIRRNLFWGNAADFHDWVGMTHLVTWESNLVQDSGLAAIGGNLHGDPMFVDDSWVMRNDSPARNAVTPAYPFDDFHGNARGQNGALHDLGAIQHDTLTAGLESQVFLSHGLTLTASGPPQMAFQLRVGDQIQSQPFPIIPGGAAHTSAINVAMDGSGAWRGHYQLPSKPNLAGKVFFVQALGRDAQHVFHASPIIQSKVSIPPSR
jgi:hypothetical protein